MPSGTCMRRLVRYIVAHRVSVALATVAVMAVTWADAGRAGFGVFARGGPAPHTETVRPRSALWLYLICKTQAGQNLNWCEGYLLGMADVLLAMGNSHLPGGICDPDYGPSILGRIFVAWVEEHPDRQNEDMAMAAQAAFVEVWPCKSGSR